MSKDKVEKCSRIKCITCENYSKETDFCKEKCIENCSKAKTDFSQCDSYLVSSRLVLF